MPNLCEFFGISVYMYWRDHDPPHFHGRYAGRKITVAIDDLSVLAGELPPRALGLLMEWATLRKDELRERWRQASTMEPIDPIEPLR